MGNREDPPDADLPASGIRRGSSVSSILNNPHVGPFDLEGLVRGPEERAAYEALDDKFELVVALLRLRSEAGLTQAQVAKRMGVTQGRVAQIESLSSAALPSLTSVRRYAAACGQRLLIGFEPAAKPIAKAAGRAPRKAAERPGKRYQARRRPRG